MWSFANKLNETLLFYLYKTLFFLVSLPFFFTLCFCWVTHQCLYYSYSVSIDVVHGISDVLFKSRLQTCQNLEFLLMVAHFLLGNSGFFFRGWGGGEKEAKNGRMVNVCCDWLAPGFLKEQGQSRCVYVSPLVTFWPYCVDAQQSIFSHCSSSSSAQIMEETLIVVSNRLPFVIKREDDGQLVRKSRWVHWV